MKFEMYETITRFAFFAFIVPLLVAQIVYSILDRRGIHFDKAVKKLYFNKNKKAKMIGKDIVIYFVKRREQLCFLVVEDSKGNSIEDVSMQELIDARWIITEQS